MDHDFLAKFIRAKKYDPESAAKAFQRYYNHIFKNLRRLEGIQPSHYIASYESRAFGALKNTLNGIRIFLVQAHVWDPSEVNALELQNSILLLCEEMFKDPAAQPYGSIVLADLAGMGFGHIKLFTPSLVKYCMDSLLVRH